MTVGDFFDFDEIEYARRISSYDLDRLRQQEVVKTRQHTAAVCSITTGFLGSIPSFGGTLVLSAYGARRLSVASRKLDLIKAEITKRGIALHELQKRDVLIPFTACCVGMGVGFGLEEAAIAATNTIPMETCLPTGSSTVEALSTDTGATISGAAHGIAEQAQEMGNAVLSLNNGIPAGQDLANDTIWVSASSAQEAIGFHSGMVVAQAAEKGAASLASNVAVTQAMERICPDIGRARKI
ncbi:hypothetical protein NW762_013153 [Fusarium torreyae]|uniref:Uncharacterized protein n=1 Tax=Fusarium torreyae TaxID=1237075 RepID=A0A9W8RP27_9HYPO|nr:hypothetical protein NW762_013153 [Fusarium torreyae]